MGLYEGAKDVLVHINNFLYFIVVLMVAKYIIKLEFNTKSKAFTIVMAISILLTVILVVMPTEWAIPMNFIVFLSIVGIMCVLNRGRFQENVLYSLATFCSISSLGILSRNLVDTTLALFGFEINNDISEMLALFVMAVAIFTLSKTNKTRYGLRDVPFRFHILICAIICIDCFGITFLGYFIPTQNDVGRKWLVELAYILVILGVFVQLGLLVAMILSRDEHKEKEALNAKYLEDQVAHYEYLEKREQETRKFRHDMKNHMMILRNLYDTGTEAEFEEYFDTISKRITAFGNQISVGNNTADAIINQYAQEAENAGIKLKVDGHFSSDCHISAVDICTIFSNLLSNAIRAEKEANGDEVELFIRNLDHDLFIEVRNDYVTQVKRSGERFISTKEDRANHGLGLQNVYDCVERNHGVIHITTDHQIFDVKLNLKNTEA